MDTMNVMTVSWGQSNPSFAAWRRRPSSCGEVTGLSDRILRDIGLPRCAGDLVSKPSRVS